MLKGIKDRQAEERCSNNYCYRENCMIAVTALMERTNGGLMQCGSLRTKTITCNAGLSGIELIQCPGHDVSLYIER
jgi:hypothetical protein